MLSKKCPFCREEINISDTTCPKCQLVLVESIKSSSLESGFEKQHGLSSEKITKKLLINYWNKLKNLTNKIKSKIKRKERVYTYQFDKWKRYKRFFWLSGVITIVILFIYFSNSSDKHSSINQGNQPFNNLQDNTYKKPESEYNSLSNGALLNFLPIYLTGLGELKIENGTDMDAVAKLVRNYPNKSVYTIYIKAGNDYKITRISDGIYKLYFVHGRDWDTVNQKFSVDRSYSKFEDSFNFVTKEEYLFEGVNTRYTTFEVTLHSVIGGSAQTDSISESEFNQF